MTVFICAARVYASLCQPITDLLAGEVLVVLPADCCATATAWPRGAHPRGFGPRKAEGSESDVAQVPRDSVERNAELNRPERICGENVEETAPLEVARYGRTGSVHPGSRRDKAGSKCPRRDSNSHGDCSPVDFESTASAVPPLGPAPVTSSAPHPHASRVATLEARPWADRLPPTSTWTSFGPRSTSRTASLA